jgi:hypothetical protein
MPIQIRTLFQVLHMCDKSEKNLLLFAAMAVYTFFFLSLFYHRGHNFQYRILFFSIPYLVQMDTDPDPNPQEALDTDPDPAK